MHAYHTTFAIGTAIINRTKIGEALSANFINAADQVITICRSRPIFYLISYKSL